MNNAKIQKMCVAAVLCAIGILIPIISPVKIELGPMSFTLASHVALFIALFISLPVGAAVTLGTSVGFLVAGFPPVVVARALSHIVFVIVGAALLKKRPQLMNSLIGIIFVGALLGGIHALCEVLVVTGFYFAGMQLTGTFGHAVWFMVGLGTFIHSSMDYIIALLIWRVVGKAVHVDASYTPTRKDAKGKLK